MSNERTFSATNNEALLYQKLAELAELLASDLQKEGLRGRTLTLKLKTASFEVRTRAMTLQKYICSSEDILWHARKLLKAELPSSLRLIGLRVSQFSEEKVEPSDPMQKSITNFVKFGDVSGSNISCNDSLELNAKGNSFASDQGDDLATCDCSTDYTHEDVFDSDQLSDLGYSNYSVNENAANEPPNNIQTEVSATGRVGHISESREPGAWHPLSSKEANETRCTNFQDATAAAPSCQQDQFQWIDDYKCYICGVELPPELVDERQEHSDFHYAEMLQEECSRSSLLNRQPKLRNIQKNQAWTKDRRKKHKSSPEQGKYLPIDKFFIKKS